MRPTMTEKKDLVFDVETTGTNPHKARMLGFSTFYEDTPGYFLAGLEYFNFKDKYVIGHNAKYDAVVAARHGQKITVSFDTLLAYYLLHIDRPRKLEKIVAEVFKQNKEDLQELYNRCTGKERKSLPEEWWKE